MTTAMLWNIAATFFIAVACPLLGWFAAYCDGVVE